MTVVSNTSPLSYLVLIEQAHLLPQLFGEVLIPRAVAGELGCAGAPPAVRTWIQNPPQWLRVVPVTHSPIADSTALHAGESEAIQLAKEVGAEALLIDERTGARVARQQQLLVVGTLGVLVEAAERDLVAFPEALDRLLRETSFYITPQFRQALLEMDRTGTRPPSAPPEAQSSAETGDPTDAL